MSNFVELPYYYTISEQLKQLQANVNAFVAKRWDYFNRSL